MLCRLHKTLSWSLGGMFKKNSISEISGWLFLAFSRCHFALTLNSHMTCRLWMMFKYDDPKIWIYVFSTLLFPFYKQINSEIIHTIINKIMNTFLSPFILENLILILKLWQLHVCHSIMLIWTGISLGNRYDCITGLQTCFIVLTSGSLRSWCIAPSHSWGARIPTWICR